MKASRDSDIDKKEVASRTSTVQAEPWGGFARGPARLVAETLGADTYTASVQPQRPASAPADSVVSASKTVRRPAARPVELVEASFGRELRRLRLRAGLSQELLAERAGLSTASIAAYERGRRRRPYMNTLGSLATALGLAPLERAAFMTNSTSNSLRELELPANNNRSMRVGLPKPPTLLFGREMDRDAVVAQLNPTSSQVRLLSLIGPGGVGKTRLALSAAETLTDLYPDGVAFVDLSAVHDHHLVAEAIAGALGLHSRPGESERDLLLDQLRERRALLVLDNLEQLLDAGLLLADLNAACPTLALLVTSRVPLRIRAEQRYLVHPLALPEPDSTREVIADSPAVRMFVDRARATIPQFRLDDRSASSIAAICRRLDGIPLAIELAAVRVALLEPATLLQRLGNALQLLQRGPVDLPERQQTLHRTLDWSHGLLGPLDQALFRRLAVFSGGWTLRTAEAVCAGGELLASDVLERLTSLTDSSLIVQSSRQVGLEPRFEMLQAIREYAQEQLDRSGEAIDLAHRHLRWALALAQPTSVEPPDPRTVACLSDEADNLLAAMHNALRLGSIEDGLWLAVAMSALWFVRGAYAQATTRLTELLTQADDGVAPAARGYALAAAGLFTSSQGEYTAADQILTGAQTLADQLDDHILAGLVRHFQGNVARARGDLDAARVAYASALEHYRHKHHTMWEATALTHLAFVLCDQGDVQQAAQCAEASLELFQEAGNTWGASRALRVLGRVAAQQSEMAKAQSLHETSIALGRELADEHDRMHSLLAMADDVLSDADAQRAWLTYHQSLALARQTGNKRLIVRGLEGLARLAAEGSPRQAVRLAGAADALRVSLGLRAQTAERRRLSAVLNSARQRLGEADYAGEWDAGRSMHLAQLQLDPDPGL